MIIFNEFSTNNFLITNKISYLNQKKSIMHHLFWNKIILYLILF